MKAHSQDSEVVSAKEVIDMVTWNRPRTTEELLSFISGHHAKLDDVELGI
jgi:hypothetical protein